MGYEEDFEGEFQRRKDKPLDQPLWMLGVAVVMTADVGSDPALRARRDELLALRATLEATSDMTVLLVANDLKKEDLTGAEIPWDTPYVLKQDLIERIDFVLNGGLGEKLAKRALKRGREHDIVRLLSYGYAKELDKEDPGTPAKEREREALLLVRIFCYQYTDRHPDEEPLVIPERLDALRRLVRGLPSRTAK